jgi:hypothetical protein
VRVWPVTFSGPAAGDPDADRQEHRDERRELSAKREHRRQRRPLACRPSSLFQMFPGPSAALRSLPVHREQRVGLRRARGSGRIRRHVPPLDRQRKEELPSHPDPRMFPLWPVSLTRESVCRPGADSARPAALGPMAGLLSGHPRLELRGCTCGLAGAARSRCPQAPVERPHHRMTGSQLMGCELVGRNHRPELNHSSTTAGGSTDRPPGREHGHRASDQEKCNPNRITLFGPRRSARPTRGTQPATSCLSEQQRLSLSHFSTTNSRNQPVHVGPDWTTPADGLPAVSRRTH